MILCSGELYDKPITTDECLDCALKMKGDQPCGYGYRLLKAMFETQQDRTSEVHVTDITGCLKKSYLDKVEPEAKYVHQILILWLGIAVHEAVEVQDDSVESELPVGNGLIKGRIDAVYDDRIEDAKCQPAGELVT